LEEKVFKKAVFPGKYIQGVNSLKELPSLVNLFGTKGLILASPTAEEKVLNHSGIDWKSHRTEIELFRRECCEEEINRIHRIVKEKEIDTLIGMGGGKTIDTAKIAADRAGVPVIIVPTIASTDAPCSGCAVIYSSDGVFESVSYQKTNPAAVLVDTSIILQAPVRFLVAGMGDALATWFEARSCHRTQSVNECGGYSLSVGLKIAEFCYETLLDYGYNGRIANEQQILTEAFERIVEANILLSGIGFESAGLAAAHGIHNGLTALEETHDYYHGEKVAFGVLAGLHLTDAPPFEMEEVYQFCENVGLPTTLAEIGLDYNYREQLMKAAEKASEPAQSVHHEAGIITKEKIFHSLLAADALGRDRKTF